MKKQVYQILVSILLLSVLFSACSAVPLETESEKHSTAITQATLPVQQAEPQQDTFSLTAAVVECSDSITVVTERSEDIFWDPGKIQMFQEPAATKIKTIDFNGVSYTGTYDYSIVPAPYTFQIDYYECEKVVFAVDHATGALYSFSLYIIEEGNKSLEECETIAREFAGQYVDLSQYQLTVNEGTAFHNFCFNRYVNGKKMADMVSVSVSPNGRVRAFIKSPPSSSESSAAILSEGALMIDMLYSEQADAVLDAKLQELLGDPHKLVSDLPFTYKVLKEELISLPNGLFGKLCDIETQLPRRTENGIALGIGITRVFIKCTAPSVQEVS